MKARTRGGTRRRCGITALISLWGFVLSTPIGLYLAWSFDFSAGMPPFLPAALTEKTSLGEEIQKAFPEAWVVKAFNTISARVMVEPSLVPGVQLLIAGNSETAKERVRDLARTEFGWQEFVDLGDIAGARGTEHQMPLWLRLFVQGGSPLVALKVIRGA